MRVVGGSARGKPLQVVPGRGTRPIMDRVKSSLFDILRPRIAGMDVLDLFAGSGGVGIEALSQGASSCVFTELAHQAIVTIRRNLASTGFTDRATVLQTDAFAFLRQTTRSFDLIYVAPPQYKDLWSEALRLIAERPTVLRATGPDLDGEQAPGQVIVQIHPKEFHDPGLSKLVEVRQRRYGNTLLVFYELAAPDAPLAPEPPEAPELPEEEGPSGFR